MSKKIEAKKTVVIPAMPKQPMPTGNESIIVSLKTLLDSSGWQILVKVMNENIAYLEKCILDKVDPLTKRALEDDEIDTLRDKRDLNLDLIATPQNYINRLREQPEGEEKTYDPYPRSAKEVVAMERDLRSSLKNE